MSLLNSNKVFTYTLDGTANESITIDENDGVGVFSVYCQGSGSTCSITGTMRIGGKASNAIVLGEGETYTFGTTSGISIKEVTITAGVGDVVMTASEG
jgi:hypothetical protein